MRTFDVIMKWVESDQKYHMIVKKTGGMIQEAPADLGFDDIHQYNCHFLPWAYKDINKETDEEYQITVTNKKEQEMGGETRDNNGQDWYVKVELTVCGPKEKPVILKGEYLGTNRNVAEALQNEFGASIAKLNEAK